ncbi:cadherin-related family member 5-like [Coregonus clupeaformis]|uniref:cadherin-related family member 5-like n=1 Tax=Coregonus clupeaformis TaxID=59861 RepID=UPI001BDF7DDB|nr:cadherin-related family member 5-like [Coregonus clupeaformis]XP_041746896.1 cadherin-related family member 5-like [Coregonus clupeaformis]
MQPQRPCLWRWRVLLWSTLLLLCPLRATGHPFTVVEDGLPWETGSGDPDVEQTVRRENWNQCLEGQDVFSTIRENSMMGELIIELNTELTANDVVWSLTGEDADWFFLEGRSIRLNASLDRVLDREVQGPVLMAALTCYEEDTVKSEYRIMVEILNENDNTPEFVESTIQTRSISELAEVNTVVFTVQATDADDDTIMYSIDQTSPDAACFRVDLPNSGEVILAKPLDYETKTQLEITIYALEMNTAEKFNTSAILTVNILDGDDQYPQFLPCTPLSNNQSNRVCTNPIYTVNITEGQQDVLLDFSPGPINAVDGDRGLSSPLSYSILSGADSGHFVMDELTGEVRLTRGVENRLQTPTLRLRVMAYQRNDPRKYSVATVVVHVVAVNHFPPQFGRAEYRGFVTEGDSPASLVNTYGNTVLLIQTQDRDFSDGINPKMHYSLRSSSNHTQFYHIIQEGLLIARTNQLRPSQKHRLKVVAVDLESGEMATALIKVEVLYEGQTVPQGPLGDGLLPGSCAVGKAMGVVILGLTLLGCALYALQHVLQTNRGQKDPEDRGCIAQGKHPNVRLQWFQLVSHSSPMPVLDEVKLKKEGLSSSTSKLLGSQSIYTPADSNSSPLNSIPIATSSTTYIQPILPSTTPTDPSHGPTSPNSTHTPATTTTPELLTTSTQPLDNSSFSTPTHPTPTLNQMSEPLSTDTFSRTHPFPIAEEVDTPTQVEETPKDTPLPPPIPINSPPHPTPPPTSMTTPLFLSPTPDPIHTPECTGDTHTPLLTPPCPEQDRVGTPPPKPTPGKAHIPVLTTPSPEQVGPPGYPEECRPSTHSPETASIGDDDCFLGDEEAIRTSDDDDDEDEELVRLCSCIQPTFLITDYDNDMTTEIPASGGEGEGTGNGEGVERERE